MMMTVKEISDAGNVRVTFSVPASMHADTIHLVGDFNNWNTTAMPLRPCTHGWSTSIDLPAGCAFRYRYLINGTKWVNDWNADFYAPNEHGGDDSVVVALLPHEMNDVEVICPYDGYPCLFALQVVHTGVIDRKAA